MPTFITISYGDQAGYKQTDASVRNAAHAHDACREKMVRGSDGWGPAVTVRRSPFHLTS